MVCWWTGGENWTEQKVLPGKGNKHSSLITYDFHHSSLPTYDFQHSNTHILITYDSHHSYTHHIWFPPLIYSSHMIPTTHLLITYDYHHSYTHHIRFPPLITPHIWFPPLITPHIWFPPLITHHSSHMIPSLSTPTVHSSLLTDNYITYRPHWLYQLRVSAAAEMGG